MSAMRILPYLQKPKQVQNTQSASTCASPAYPSAIMRAIVFRLLSRYLAKSRNFPAKITTVSVVSPRQILLILSKHLPTITKLAEIHARRISVREPMDLPVRGRMSWTVMVRSSHIFIPLRLTSSRRQSSARSNPPARCCGSATAPSRESPSTPHSQAETQGLPLFVLS